MRNRLLRFIDTQKRTVLTDDISTFKFDFQQAHDTTLMQNETDKQRNQQLQTAIETLSPRQREALYLRFYQNLSYEEIANIMNVEQQSAYNLIFRGVEALRKQFGYLLFWLILQNPSFILKLPILPNLFLNFFQKK